MNIIRTVLLWDGADFNTFFSYFFAWKYGTLDKRSFYCTLSVIAEIEIGILVLGYFLFAFYSLKNPENLEYLRKIMDILDEHPWYVILPAVYVLFTPFEASGLVRRLNDAGAPRIYAWCLAVPIIGNVMGMLIGILV